VPAAGHQERRDTYAQLRAPVCHGDDIEQFLATIASDRRDDPKLGKMGAERVEHPGLVADKEIGTCDGALGSSVAQASWSRRNAWLPW
jgi:hypothetical protein